MAVATATVARVATVGTAAAATIVVRAEIVETGASALTAKAGTTKVRRPSSLLHS
jgi:hypothetical protein